MTKNYDIIALNNHLYMVDKEASIEGKNWRTDGVEIRQDFPDAFPKWNKILASTDTSLGLPLLPDIHEGLSGIVDEYILDRYKNSDNPLYFNTIACKKDFLAGYKAAYAKKYTEQDMRNAFNAGTNHGELYQMLIADENWEAVKNMEETGIEPDFQKFLKQKLVIHQKVMRVLPVCMGLIQYL